MESCRRWKQYYFKLGCNLNPILNTRTLGTWHKKICKHYIFRKLLFVIKDYVPRHIDCIAKAADVDKNIREVQNERKELFINK